MTDSFTEGYGDDAPPPTSPSGSGRPGITLVYARAIAAARNPALSASHVAVLYAIALRFYREPECWPGVETLRDDAKVANSTLYLVLADLELWGMVRRERPRKGRASVTYTINLDRLATMDALLPSGKRSPEPVSDNRKTLTNRFPIIGSPVSDNRKSGFLQSEVEVPIIGNEEIREETKEETKEEVSRPGPGRDDHEGGVSDQGAKPGDTQPSPAPSPLTLTPPAAPARRRTKAPKAPKPPRAPAADPAEVTRPVREAYEQAYLAAVGEPPDMAAADNTSVKRLVAQVGPEKAIRLIRDVYAIPAIRKRYPSIREIASNPARVRSEIAGEALSEAELTEARAWMRANQGHAISATLRDRKGPPTREELWQMRRERTPFKRGPVVQEQPADGPLYDAQNDF